MTATTREELVGGLRMLAREGSRLAATFTADDWKRTVHDEDGGWNVKQIYCHLAATAEVVPALAGRLAESKEGDDTAAGLDLDAFNAQQVAAREGLGEPELIKAYEQSHQKLIEFAQGLPDEQLQQRRRFANDEGTVAELMQLIIVMHGLSHVYHAASGR